MATSYNSDLALSSGIKVTTAAPVDIRTVVDTVDDLKSISYVYQGIVVNIKGTSDLYVLTTSARLAKNLSSWKKIGGSDAAGATIVSSSAGLTEINFAYPGMIALVQGESGENELYVLSQTPATTLDNWIKISSGSAESEYFKFDTDIDAATAPEGLSITTDKDTIVSDYLTSGNTVKADSMYTSQGILATGETNPILEDVDYIDLYPAEGDGSSYIRLYRDGDNWINIYGDASALGLEDFQVEEGAVVNENGDIRKGDTVSFGKDMDFTGWNVRTSGNDVYTFGNQVGYDDIDIYTESYLPVAYITVDGLTERVLTETDKNEITDRISNMGDSIMININTDDSDSENDERISIQDAITNITNNITNMNVCDCGVISNEEIEDLFE